MGKVVRTETTVREMDADGSVVREVTTVVSVDQPVATESEPPGLYL